VICDLNHTPKQALTQTHTHKHKHVCVCVFMYLGLKLIRYVTPYSQKRPLLSKVSLTTIVLMYEGVLISP
jgi:hypothetical protein